MSLTKSFSDPELEDIALAFVVANTPRSLWAWLKQHPAVRRVMSYGALESLQAEWNDVLERSESHPLRPAALSALFAAMVGVCTREGGQLREPKGLREVPWGGEFWGFASFSAAPSSVFVSVSMPPDRDTESLLANSGYGTPRLLLNHAASGVPIAPLTLVSR